MLCGFSLMKEIEKSWRGAEQKIRITQLEANSLKSGPWD